MCQDYKLCDIVSVILFLDVSTVHTKVRTESLSGENEETVLNLMIAGLVSL